MMNLYTYMIREVGNEYDYLLGVAKLKIILPI